MTNTTQYKGHTIRRTSSYTTVFYDGAWRGAHRRIRPLYEIEGPVDKSAAIRPFITSLKEAKEWITENSPETNARHFAGNSVIEIDGFRVEMMAWTGETSHQAKVFEIDEDGDGHFVGYAGVKVRNGYTTDLQLRRAIAAM